MSHVILLAFEAVRKRQLEKIIENVKRMPCLKNEINEVDKVVSEAGHEILPLPPYQCKIQFTFLFRNY